jgi:hypothetical protein
MLASYLDLVSTPTNSDYYPFVDLNAGKARYTDASATSFDGWMRAPLPLLEMLHGDLVGFDQVTTDSYLLRNNDVVVADWMYRKFMDDSIADPDSDESLGLDRLRYFADWLILSKTDCVQDANPDRWRDTAFEVALISLQYLDPERAEKLVERMHATECESLQARDAQQWRDLYTAIARRSGDAMSSSARSILESDYKIDLPRRTYVLAAAMLGDVAAGRPLDAHEAWNSFGAEQYRGRSLPPHLKLLVSIAVGAASQAELAARL